jgi:hypothetical protein
VVEHARASGRSTTDGWQQQKQTVGYRYRMGLHLVLCQGPVDAVQEIQMGDRTAWGDADRAPLSSGHGLTSLSINKPTLFGGDEREGGVVGTIDVLPGGPGQGRNDYLMSAPRQRHSGLPGRAVLGGAQDPVRGQQPLHQAVGGARAPLHGGLARCAVDGVERRSPHLG